MCQGDFSLACVSLYYGLTCEKIKRVVDEKSHALKLRCPSFLTAELGDGPPASELFVVGNGPPATELRDGDGLLPEKKIIYQMKKPHNFGLVHSQICSVIVTFTTDN